MAEIMSRAQRVKVFVQQQQVEALKVAASIVEMVKTETDIDVRPLLRLILTPYGYERAMSVFDEALGRIDTRCTERGYTKSQPISAYHL